MMRLLPPGLSEDDIEALKDPARSAIDIDDHCSGKDDERLELLMRLNNK